MLKNPLQPPPPRGGQPWFGPEATSCGRTVRVVSLLVLVECWLLLLGIAGAAVSSSSSSSSSSSAPRPLHQSSSAARQRQRPLCTSSTSTSFSASSRCLSSGEWNDDVGTAGTIDALWELRGGDSPQKKKKKKTKTDKTNDDRPTKLAAKKSKAARATSSSSTTTATAVAEEKAQLNKALHESDAAEALGDAIRARADLLRGENLTTTVTAESDAASTLFPDPSLSSLAWSLGASDYGAVKSTSARRSGRNNRNRRQRTDPALDDDVDDSGGVAASPSAVVASYFLTSHGGAHALQSLCSLLAATAGMGAIGLAGRGGGSGGSQNHHHHLELSLTLLKRACAFALIKHVSGVAAAALLTARAIPDVGFGPARRWMQHLALDPVSQYCFYSALLLVWLPSRASTIATTSTSAAATSSTAPPDAWWTSHAIITLFLAGPIVLREVVSTALVTGDVLLLLSAASQQPEGGGTAGAARLLALASSVVNAAFSVLVTPRVWRGATPAQKQAVLAKLVQKCSLALEVAVGALLALDAVRAVMEWLFAPQRPSLVNVLKRGACARWYVMFLRTRRHKIRRLAEQVRGGALHVPQYVLEVLLDPPAAMGLPPSAAVGSPNRRTPNAAAEVADGSQVDGPRGWWDYLKLALESDD